MKVYLHDSNIIPQAFTEEAKNVANLNTLRTLIFARHLFSRVHIFAAYIFAPEALRINFRYVSIFAWWLFSLFLQKIHWK